MRYRILGPLVAGDAAPTAARDRIVLAVLLLRAGRVVGVDELVDAVWDDEPPATARGQLQTCVSRLRRLLPPGAIRTDPAGYGIHPGPDDLDVLVFTRLVAAAAVAGDRDVALAALRDALGLWRGPALAGIGGRLVAGAARMLDEQRMLALEDRMGLELDAGRARELIVELTGLVDRFPLRERLRGRLIRALADAGRTADALAEYDRAVAVLRDEAGLEPGPELRGLRDRLVPAGVPRWLPRPVGDFTGRDRESARLLTALHGVDRPGVVVIDGMAGVGKTALAVHLAGLAAERYPDAQLFVDLLGQGAGSPLDPAAALLVLLRQLGVPADRIPGGAAERVALWRSRLAGRRALVVLDDAATSAQVEPLLPAEAGQLALVTSRRRLSGLDGVRTESIDVLDESTGVALLSRIVGDRVAAEPAAAARLVRRCGGLPLALRLAGARLVHRPQWAVSDLIRRLDAAGLPALAAEDRSVAGVFALSYGQLPAAARRTFALLGVHPDSRFDARSVAALADLPLPAAERLVETYADLHLIEEPESELYRLHDLMREYAAILAADDPATARAAVSRVAEHYREVVDAFARSTQNRSSIGRMNEPFTRPDLVEATGDLPGWLETHRSGLLPVVEAAAPREAWRLAHASFRFCFTRGYTDDLCQIQARGLAAARTAGDPFAVAESLYFVSAGHTMTGRLPKSIELQTEALELHLAAGDLASADKVRTNLADVLGMVGRIDETWELAAAAAEGWLRRGTGFGWYGLSSAGEAAMYQGRYADALRCQRLLWAIGRFVGHPIAPAMAVSSLGEIRLRMGRPRLALDLVRGGIRRKEALNYRVGMVGDLTRLAVVHRELGEPATAVEQHERALRTMADLNELRWESVVCNDYGGTLLASGDPAGALALYRRALGPARRSGIAYEQARALAGIARCVAGADPDAALAGGRQAWEIFAAMGAVDRLALAAWLRERGARVADNGPDPLRRSSGESRMER